MKKLIAVMILLTTNILVKAESYSSIFSFNEAAIEAELSSVNNIEEKILQTGNTESLSTNETALLLFDDKKDDDPLMGVPAFWWGFGGAFIGACGVYGTGYLGVAAVVAVYFLTDEDKQQAKKAFLGCVVGTIVGCGAGIFTWFFISGGWIWATY